VAAWGEYLLCVTLVDDEAKRTMPVVLAAAQSGQGQWAWPNIAAVYVIVVAPGVVAFTFAQRLFFKGLLEGALKAESGWRLSRRRTRPQRCFASQPK
jgi:ABC-type glycerol-3-phosphate transport system permease component